MKRGFRDFHPAVCFVYYAGSLLLLLLMVHPFFTLSALVVLFAVNLLYDAGKRLLQLKSVILMTAGIILIVNPLTSERGAHILWEGMSHRITLEAVLYGGMMAGTVVGVIASFASYQQVISTHQFLYLFSRLLPQWALLTVLSLRFVPLMQRRLEEIMRVQRSREGEMSNFHFREQLRRRMKRLEVLLTWSLEDGLQTADSMKARGYGAGRRSSYIPYRWRLSDGVSLFFLMATAGLCLFGWVQGMGVLTIYPIMESLMPTDQEWMLLAGYLSFFSFPILVEMGGMNA
ncbi:energy-coupling factor transporter transmembrane component T [Melghirimyces algeriensis]|uniref:Energy-coupling factor transport system permease protein n=1 Tax=Melghirimyces algeriensis TaxID=910412 RepID=A0A521FG88_9BACL|nr:energy-coupling factor transporter transmembrane component T [Melghirimyces algeriensis]SMO95159.1 energy-coupling factor transport system permease protein [Melghirimyces algeriensis]